MRLFLFNILSYMLQFICKHDTVMFIKTKNNKFNEFCPDCGKMLKEDKNED